MRGQNDLIAMRLAGESPKSLWVYDYPVDTDWAKWGEAPRVCVAADPIVELDFRFAVGMVVHIDGHDKKRIDRLAQKFFDAGAVIVAGSAYPTLDVDPFGKTPSQHSIFYRHFENQNDNHHHTRLG